MREFVLLQKMLCRLVPFLLFVRFLAALQYWKMPGEDDKIMLQFSLHTTLIRVLPCQNLYET